MRGWLMPWLMTAPLAIGDVVAPGSELGPLLAGLLCATVSLAIVAAAWAIGGLRSRWHATFAALVTATWFELVYFGPRILGELLATAAILAAAALFRRRPTDRIAIMFGGLLLGLAIVLRPQYGPACVPIALIAVHGKPAEYWRALLIGGAMAALFSAVGDFAAGATPFAWLITNIQQNLIDHKAQAFGVAPPLAYISTFGLMWRWWMVMIVAGVIFGFRRAPMIGWAALLNLVIHSLIGHKEYRFVVFSDAAFLLIAALGWADLADRAGGRWPDSCQ